MRRRPFDRQEHVYRNDAFAELVKDGAFCKTKKTDSIKIAPILKNPKNSMNFDLKSKILSEIKQWP